MSIYKEKGGNGSIEYASSIVHHDGEYDYGTDFKDVDRSKGASSTYAYYNVVCVIAGTGTLGLPHALAQGGWIGIFILVLALLMSTYTAIILVRCLYAKGDRRLSCYKDVATASFGAVGGWITFFFNAWLLLGVPVLYMVLSGANLQELCKNTPGAIGPTPWTIVSCAIIAIPLVLLKNMKETALMSAFGSLSTAVTVIIVLVVACIDQKDVGPVHHDPVIWNQFPIALSTIAFSYGGNVIYSHVEASMRRPKDWPKVAAAGLGTCACLYFLTAIPGYYVYGVSVKSPVYDSIPDGVPKTIAIVLMTAHVLTASPLLCTSFALDLEDMLGITVEKLGRWKEFILRAILRIIVIVIVGVVACFVPHFDLLMGLIGSFANCGLIFIFPVVFYLKLTGVRNKPIYELAWCALIAVLGIVGLIFGTKDSIKGLIKAYE